ncbi:hypothetical protein [Rhodococcoides fascians]|uniref:hypothetical protein n=1 Tax=Rhodococcoides fascians TaxID=1828 RepID=UPI000AD06908|nr:hypothetical protein [Rhodococcus fascians]
MGSTVTIALISAAAVVLSALVGFLGVVVARRSDRDDDTREWVALRMEKQDETIRQLDEKVAGLSSELKTAQSTAIEAQETALESERRTFSLVGYVRELLAWASFHLPDVMPPAARGLAREVLHDD